MEQSLKGTWISFCLSPRIYSRLLVLSGHVETVVLMSKGAVRPVDERFARTGAEA